MRSGSRGIWAFDIIRRYFEYKGFKVTYVQNITDVDDKIIAAANREGIDSLEYSKKFTIKCLNDLDHLGIRRADLYPKASETIDDMIKLTEKIIKNGYGYESDGDVYFSVEKFSDYGKLSGQKLKDLMYGVRINPEDKKHNPFDFALWKSSKPDEPSWNSPWGKGRPGWHIECSAMSSKFLGLPFDIHGGGMDLRFPHHENEIAQAEAATGKDFARFWMHIGLLTVNGEKMSKSIGNIINVKDLLNNWKPEIIRFFFAQAHYRSPPDFSEKALKNSKKGLDRIYRVKEKLEDCIPKKVKNSDDYNNIFNEKISDFKSKFESAMDDDFNTPEAVSSIFDFVNNCNRYFVKVKNPNSTICKNALNTLIKLGNVLTLFQDENKELGKIDDDILKQLKKIASLYIKDVEGKNIEEVMYLLIETREKARKRKDWNTADSIRNNLDKLGFEIQDTFNGSVWRKK